MSELGKWPWWRQAILGGAIGLGVCAVLVPVLSFFVSKEQRCSRWNTEEFLRTATLHDVAPCIRATDEVDSLAGGVTPLFRAAGDTRDPQVIGALLDAGADPTFTVAGSGFTPLHHGAESPLVEVVTLLLDAGADPNVSSVYGYAPLHIAAQNDNPMVAAKLLAAGADGAVAGTTGITPLHLAKTVEVAMMLLERDASVDARMSNGVTPLLMAAEAGNLGVVRTLLEEGGNPHALTESNASALDFATLLNSHPDTVGLLLDRGVNPGAQSDAGLTPLHHAAYGSSSVVELLLDAGADANASSDNDTTPLHVAATWNADPGVSSLLLANGGNPSEPDSTGSTPLHLAAYWNPSRQVLDVLIEAGADPNAPNHRGDTPLHMAARRTLDASAFMEKLLAAGADPQRTNEDGERAAGLLAPR